MDLGAGLVKNQPGDQNVVRRPEDEELDDDHEEHLDHALLGGPRLLAVGLAHCTVRFEASEWAGN